MKCDEARPLQGAYLDSELDARTTLEIEQHLKSCAECANQFAEEARQEARMRASLNHGEKSSMLWEQIERSVEVAGRSSSAAQTVAGARSAQIWRSALGALGEQVRAGWRRSRWAWSAMAAGWAIIAALNLAAPEAEAPAAAAQALPPASELRLAMKQKRLLSAGLAALAEQQPAATAKRARQSPRSERSNGNLNT